MAVITPLRSEYARASHVSWLATGRYRAGNLVRTAILTSADIFAFLFAVCATTALTWIAGTEFTALAGGAPLHVGLTAATDCIAGGGAMLFFARHSHYTRRIPFWSELRDVLAASVVALLCSGFVQFLFQFQDSRLLVGLTWVLFPILVMASRRGARRLLAGIGRWELRAVIIGSSGTAREAELALLSEPALGYSIAAVIEPHEAQTWPSNSRWQRILQQQKAELLILTLDPSDPQVREMTESLVRERVPFAVIPQLDGLPVLGFEKTSFFSHDTVMFLYRNNLAQPVARLIKISFDLFAAICLLIILAPVMLLIAAAVKLDGGPVLFAHRRVGAGGREFPCFKFRSMVIDSDAVLRRVLATDRDAAAEWAETQKLRNDPRVTWIGRMLRATSLDELPQLFNVLRLEMSLVGPRPIVHAEIQRYGRDIAFYYEARPGVTGLWQVSGRSETSYAQRVRLDTWYVKNWTLWHDLAILAKTVPAVLQRRGAV